MKDAKSMADELAPYSTSGIRFEAAEMLRAQAEELEMWESVYGHQARGAIMGAIRARKERS